jgi:hypothetical protein
MKKQGHPNVNTYVDLVAEARASLPALDALSAPHTAERAELRAAGVSAARIQSLYPFSLDEHLPKMTNLLAIYESFHLFRHH